MSEQLEQLARDYAEGQAAIEELAKTQQYLAIAVSKLPKSQLKVSLSQQLDLDAVPYRLEGKTDDKGNLFLRAVKSYE